MQDGTDGVPGGYPPTRAHPLRPRPVHEEAQEDAQRPQGLDTGVPTAAVGPGHGPGQRRVWAWCRMSATCAPTESTIEVATEAPMENFGGFVRLVRRNDAAVKAVLISGREAFHDGAVAPKLGQERRFGRVLRAR